jgi:hypothetical protein
MTLFSQFMTDLILLFLLRRTGLSITRKHLRECRKMCLHVKELPSEGLGRVAAHISSLPPLDDIGAHQHAQLLLLVLLHNGVQRGSSTIFLENHLGGDG